MRYANPLLSRRRFLLAASASAFLQACGGGGGDDTSTAQDADRESPSVLAQMNDVALQLVRKSKYAPPAVARALALLNTAAYDAFAAYHSTAVGTTWTDASERRPASEHTHVARKSAIAAATYTALADLFPSLTAELDTAYVGLGFAVPSTEAPTGTTPVHVGRRAAATLMAARHDDGSNQLGLLTASGTPYADYTGFSTPNTWDVLVDPNQWQPLRYIDGSGTLVTQKFAVPQWSKVKPFALASGDALRPAAPARWGSAELDDEIDQVLAIAEALDDRTKCIAEYWADGPNSELPPGHWNLFCQYVCQRDQGTLEQDVRLFLAVSNAAFDAGIAAWDAKVTYNLVRPITAVRTRYAGQQLHVPGTAGMQSVMGESWVPYQRSTFPTPPFAEYVSGHSTFSAACAEVLRLATGGDAFGASTTIAQGSSTVEAGVAPSAPVTLSWSTFTEAANEAGFSRLYGGIHFDAGNRTGLAMGREVGRRVWARVDDLWNGRG